METNYGEIEKVVSGISPVENGQMVSYRDRDYWIGISPEGPVAEASDNSCYSGADVYVWDRVPEEFRRSVILHEIVEADLHFFQNVSQRESHRKAVELDRQFAEKHLDKKAFAKYKEFRRFCSFD